MAISTAAAIIGSAVVGAGASALSSASAAKKAANASNYAADQNAQVSREIYNQTRTDLAPYNAAGQGALSALMVRLGLQPTNAPQGQPANANVGGSRPSVISTQGFGGYGGGNVVGSAPAGTPSFVAGAAETAAGAQPAGQPDFAAYGAANSDLQAEWQRIQQTGNASRFDNDPNAYYAWHWQQYGQNEPNRQPPPVAGQPASPAPQPVDPNAPPAEYYQETYAERPADLEVPTFQRGPDVQFRDYGDGPQVGDFIDPSKFQVDPGYQFRLKEGLNAVNAASAARGKLRSGDAARALQERGEGLANQGYNDWYQRQLAAYNASRGAFQDTRNFGTDQSRYLQGRQDANFIDDRSYGTNLWNTRQNRADNVFADDRNFAANRNDQATANLFNLVNVGTGAAAGAANAGNVFAQNTINSNNQRAATTANAAIANGQNISNLFGSAAGAVGTYYGLRGRAF